MHRVLAALMLLLVTFDATPVAALAAAHARTPARACACGRECRCAHCTAHHGGTQAPPATGSVLDCAGCSGTRGSDATPPVVTPYELPAATPIPMPSHVLRSTAGVVDRPESSPRRAPDPPPRPAAA